MSLINDAIKLNATEKELHHLEYPFSTIPAMKIAKLAVSEIHRKQYKGIGTYMIYLATGIAGDTNEKHSACRFITVDADIEHDPNVTAFYKKNGFIPNMDMNGKRSKTISMRATGTGKRSGYKKGVAGFPFFLSHPTRRASLSR
jgi:hypothetical protein